MHKVMVATLSFSANEDYLASVGGVDDKNMLIIWSLESSKNFYNPKFSPQNFCWGFLSLSTVSN
jgi:WD40 repeat protein